MKPTAVDSFIMFLLFAVVVAGCQKTSPVAPKGNPKPAPSGRLVDCRSLPPQAIAQNNRGVGLMEQFDYISAQDVFAKLVQEYPGCPELAINLAIAELNKTESSTVALSLLSDVLKADPGHIRASYVSAALLVHERRFAEAIPLLQRLFESDSRDPYIAYLMAESYEESSLAQAIEWHLKAIELDPLFLAPNNSLIGLSHKSGKPDEALRYADADKKLRNHPRTRLFAFKYKRMGPKADVIRLDGQLAPAIPPPNGDLFATAVPLLDELSAREWSRESQRPNVTAADLDLQGSVLFFIARALDGESPNVVLVRTAEGRWSDERGHPLAAVRGVNAALWGDYDNDGRTDVYLCRRGPNQLWRQTSFNKWQDVTESTGTAGGEVNTVDGAFFDADHDGDLDLFLVNASGPNELLNNNLNGTFRPLAAQSGVAGDGTESLGVHFADLDGDNDLDIVVIKATSPHEVYWNDRVWTYRPAGGFQRFAQSRILAIVSGDLDADGQVELYTSGEDGLVRWQPDSLRVWQPTVLAAEELRGSQPLLELIDVDGDGRLELIGGREQWNVYRIGADRATKILSSDAQPLAAWTPVLLDAVKGPSLVQLPLGGPPSVLQPGPGRHYPYLSIVASGKTAGGEQERSNASGIGTHVELRVGRQTSVLAGSRRQSGPGQSLQPLAIGLGGKQRADYLLLRWSDGVSQAELEVDPRRPPDATIPQGQPQPPAFVTLRGHRISETNRMPTSCPVLFVWNGDHFEFVSDLLGVGGLGYFVAPGQYAPPNPLESFLLPFGCLAEQGGCFRLKLAEPMEELTYLDRAQLVAYDLPPGWQMTLDERMGINAPFPTGKPRYYRQLAVPSKAVNDRGENVISQVLTRDAEAAAPGTLHPHFTGMLAREHVLQLTWDRPLDEPDRQPVLIADGWVEYPYSQTAFAAWQAGKRFEAVTIEARAPNGEWQLVLREFGYPAGMPRQMSVPLDRLPQGTTELRLRTNQEVYWDRLAVAFTEPCPDVRKHILPLARAEMRDVGFTPRVVNEQRRPFFDDTVRLPFASTRDPAGFYTEFGRVDELVAQQDNALAIFGPGEELELAFSAPTRAQEKGWRRELVLEVVGWCKDMDLYTEHGETVEPLPLHGPLGSVRDELHKKYNTRYQSGR